MVNIDRRILTLGVGTALAFVLMVGACERKAATETTASADGATQEAPSAAEVKAGTISIDGAAKASFGIQEATISKIASEMNVVLVGPDKQFVSIAIARDLFKAGEFTITGLGSGQAFSSEGVMASYSDKEGVAYLASDGKITLTDASDAMNGRFEFKAHQAGKTESITVKGSFTGAKLPSQG